MRYSFRPAALLSAAPIAIALVLAAPPVWAQGPQMIQPLDTDADKLGVVMRRLATAPNDSDALVTAGELSLKLDDLRAAASFFARAEKADPRNARMKAGMASILVRSERPGEALRYFGQAESLGLNPAGFAGDRALAYDLLGQQDRAQRDYRLALARGGDDEILRRYALSLGISGNRALALQQIDTLVRRQDRGAWRARAFILAMTGDQAGASKIATTMMPGALGSGLQPFFERLPTLSAIDRAFAVHFGEVRPTPERLADARLMPALPALGVDPSAPVMVAAIPSAPTQTASRTATVERGQLPGRARARNERPSGRSGSTPVQMVPAQLASVQSAPVRPVSPVAVRSMIARPAPSPVVPSRVTLAASPMQMVQSVPTTSVQAASVPTAQAATETATPGLGMATLPASGGAVRPLGPGFAGVATAATPRAGSSLVGGMAAPRAQADGTLPASTVAQLAAIPLRSTAPDAEPGTTAGDQTRPGFASLAPVTMATAPDPVAVAQSGSSAALAMPRTPLPATIPPAFTPPVSTGTAAPVQSAAVSPMPTSPPPSSLPPSSPPRSEDAVLARIVAGLAVPMADLMVDPTAVAHSDSTPSRIAPSTVAAPTPTPTPTSVRTKTATRMAAEATLPVVRSTRGSRQKPAVPATASADPVETPVASTRLTRRQAARAAAAAAARENAEADAAVETAAAVKPAVKKTAKPTAAERKALAEKKAAADKKALADKQAADEKTLAKADPGRIWVQVAGGANAGDLPKAWSAVQGKAAALKGRPAYATPLRATNRVVTGPFKTDAEARAFVNTLAKQGVSAFTFTSDKGQKLTKLPTR